MKKLFLYARRVVSKRWRSCASIRNTKLIIKAVVFFIKIRINFCFIFSMQKNYSTLEISYWLCKIILIIVNYFGAQCLFLFYIISRKEDIFIYNQGFTYFELQMLFYFNWTLVFRKIIQKHRLHFFFFFILLKKKQSF